MLYPAGRLWHYVPVYFLFLHTDIAEYVLIAIQITIHSAIILIVANMSYKYFKKTPEIA